MTIVLVIAAVTNKKGDPNFVIVNEELPRIKTKTTDKVLTKVAAYRLYQLTRIVAKDTPGGIGWADIALVNILYNNKSNEFEPIYFTCIPESIKLEAGCWTPLSNIITSNAISEEEKNIIANLKLL